MPNNLITASEYALLHNVSPRAIRKRAQSGTLKAEKVGRDWLINKDEPYTDNRIKSGEFKNWRKK